MLNYGSERHVAVRSTPAIVVAGGRQTTVVPPEKFGAELERELARHARYLSVVGVAFIGTTGDESAREALREAIETETRRTDLATELPDGSWALLAVNASDRELEALVRRIEAVAAEIAGAAADASAYFGAAAATGARRLDACELWAMLVEAHREAHRTGASLVFGTWEG